jgi:magnesium-transporting ATPase (P-type)
LNFIFSEYKYSEPNDINVIQRIQTIFLTLAALLNLVVFFTPIYRHAIVDPSVWIGYGFSVTLTVATLICLLSIFYYKNRPKQLQWVKIGTLFQIVAIGFASGVLFSLGGFGSFLMKEVLSTGLLILALIALWQAGVHIKKDEELVQSMDRLR